MGYVHSITVERDGEYERFSELQSFLSLKYFRRDSPAADINIVISTKVDPL